MPVVKDTTEQYVSDLAEYLLSDAFLDRLRDYRESADLPELAVEYVDELVALVRAYRDAPGGWIDFRAEPRPQAPEAYADYAANRVPLIVAYPPILRAEALYHTSMRGLSPHRRVMVVLFHELAHHQQFALSSPDEREIFRSDAELLEHAATVAGLGYAALALDATIHPRIRQLEEHVRERLAVMDDQVSDVSEACGTDPRSARCRELLFSVRDIRRQIDEADALITSGGQDLQVSDRMSKAFYEAIMALQVMINRRLRG